MIFSAYDLLVCIAIVIATTSNIIPAVGAQLTTNDLNAKVAAYNVYGKSVFANFVNAFKQRTILPHPECSGCLREALLRDSEGYFVALVQRPFLHWYPKQQQQQQSRVCRPLCFHVLGQLSR